MYPNNPIRIVDQQEYEKHKIMFKYPNILIEKIDKTIMDVVDMQKNKSNCFNDDIIDRYIKQLKKQWLLNKNFRFKKDKID
jgi:protein associated with RNAse G/E